MKYVFTSIIFFYIISAHAQLGINFRYQNMNPSLWKEQANINNLFASNYELGLDYWLRLKNYRIEFMPELFASRSGTNTQNINYSFQSVGIAANTNFYIFDFIGDCNCPTFSKDGNFFSKGFFLSLAPILEYQQKQLKFDFENNKFDNDLNFAFSIGAGLDIGILDLITISPFVRYKMFPSISWNGFAEAHSLVNQTDKSYNINYLQLGLRLGFRPDYIREQNKFKNKRR